MTSDHPASFIAYYPEPLGNGRAIMRVDIVIEGRLAQTHTDGSPAPIGTVREHARVVPL